MAWRGSISRAMMSTARASSSRSAPRLRPPPVTAPRFSTRRLSSPRTLGELGCAQSLLSLAGSRLTTSHLTVNVRAFCELSHGTFCRSCQDR
ncbi:hypothetical protein QVD17_27385 [Tagetes erecta]|uniref:Uncharacterized protein n=1 Tax=Tagetes erecta TaxID=13708 RepID=A0AAD8KD18_TARER|nr:hypothetical protein QVD17_27385 [Tagetes erecta]